MTIIFLVILGVLSQLVTHWKTALIFIIAIFGSMILIAVLADYIKYKDETSDEREKRLLRQNMVEKWREQFKKH